GQIGLDIRDRFAQQLFEPFPVRIERYSAVYEESQVWPDLMDIFQIVPLDDLFHAQLDPARYADQETDIPLRRQPDDFFQLFGPVLRTGDLFARFVERLKPERHFPGGDAAKIAGIIPGAFLQTRAAPDHQPALADAFYRDVPVGSQGQQLFDHDDAVAAEQVIRDRNVFTACFGRPRRQCIILDLSRPADVRFALEGLVPPARMDLIVIESRNHLLEFFSGVAVEEELIEPISLTEFGKPGLLQ